MKKLFTLLAFTSCFLSLNSFANQESRVIYGDDNRLEVYQASAPWQKLADSTVVLVFNTDLRDMGDGRIKVGGEKYSSFANLCPDTEKNFQNQNSLGFCSGSLITPNIVLTAGHCITTQSGDQSWGSIPCDKVQMIFNFGYKTKDQNLDFVPRENVYACKQLIYREQNGFGADFALVYLDRAVTNHQPLSLDTSNTLKVGDSMVVIGHPEGIPTKISGGAKVRSVSDGFFVSNLDTFGGNSGSAVLNEKTGLVEGVLVRGNNDFSKDQARNCYMAVKCKDNECRGEDSTSISAVLGHIPQMSLSSIQE